MSWFGTADPIGAAWDLAREAALVGWLATALFCAVAGAAIALWGDLRWWVGALLGAVGLYPGLALLLVLAGLRVGERTRAARADRRAAAPGYPGPIAPVYPGPAVPAQLTTPPPETGLRATVGRGWRRWTRTPPTRAETLVAVLAVAVAIALLVATQVTWLTLSAVGHGVTSVGPFAIQLGLFVVLSALAALVCAAGVVRWRSAWWPVLLAWFGAWWLFVAIEVVRAGGALGALNRLLRSQVRDRLGYDARPSVELGVGWPIMIWLAAAMLGLSLVLLVLQGRRAAQYGPLARR